MSGGPLLLAIDVGNTNTVLGVYDLSPGAGTDLVDHWRAGTSATATTDELGVLYQSFFAARGLDPSRVAAAVVSCVVPPAVHPIGRACSRYFGVDALFVGDDVDTGITLDVENPREVGADRIVNALAAWERFGGAAIVVDFGTATTFDVVGADGVYRGGVICAGLGISLEALFLRASKLPRVDIRRPDRVLGRSTVASMQSGIVYGYVGLVDGLVARLKAEMPEEDVRVVATGGLAGLIASETRSIDRVEPFLTLEGLRLVHVRAARLPSAGSST